MRGMRSLRFLTSIAVAVTALSHGLVFAGPPPHRAVRVGISLDGPVLAASRHAPAMIAEADAIWRPYGVTIVLVDPSAPGAMAACDVRLTVSFAPSARQGRGRTPNSLGAIWFEDGAPSRSLNVDVDLVAASVREGGFNGRALDRWPPALTEQVNGRALGRVLAHEIGHFLLASSAHTQTGLMRAAFNGRILAGWDRMPFRLSRTELPRLQARLARLDLLDKPVITAGGETAGNP